MRRVLQIAALTLVLGSGALWVAGGASRGWTKTSVAVKTVDEVTGLEGITYRRQFVAGLDFLGGALLGGGVLAGASLFCRNKTKTNN